MNVLDGRLEHDSGLQESALLVASLNRSLLLSKGGRGKKCLLRGSQRQRRAGPCTNFQVMKSAVVPVTAPKEDKPGKGDTLARMLS